MTGAGLDLISACLAVSLFNLAVCLSYAVLLLVSVPMDETFSAAALFCNCIYSSRRSGQCQEYTSHLHGHDLNDGRCDWPSALPWWGQETVSELVCSLNKCQNHSKQSDWRRGESLLTNSRNRNTAVPSHDCSLRREWYYFFSPRIYDLGRNVGGHERCTLLRLKAVLFGIKRTRIIHGF